MSDHSGADVVASGLPYTVTAVDGRAPTSLADFGGDLIEVVAARGEERVTIRGTGQRLDDGTAMIHEKTYDGVGKDVRTWTITLDANVFTAVERSVF